MKAKVKETETETELSPVFYILVIVLLCIMADNFSDNPVQNIKTINSTTKK